VQTEAKISLGFGDSSNQGHSWMGDLDAQNPIISARRHNIAQIVSMNTPAATGSSSTTEAEADLQNLASDQFELDWTTADATAREYLWVALGDAIPDNIVVMTQSPVVIYPTTMAGY
jgi:hypothetical protein